MKVDKRIWQFLSLALMMGGLIFYFEEGYNIENWIGLGTFVVGSFYWLIQDEIKKEAKKK